MTRALPPPLRIDIAARAEQLAAVRDRLSQSLFEVGVSSSHAADMLLVVKDACTSSIEHGHSGIRPGRVRISAETAVTAICITIEDFGRWKSRSGPTDITRGRGLPLMRAVSTRVDLTTGNCGGRVSMTFPSP